MDEPGRARYLAATAEAAAVRLIVMSIESRTARGRPFVPSQTTINPWIVGRWCSRRLCGEFVFGFAAELLGLAGSRPALLWGAPPPAVMPRSFRGGGFALPRRWKDFFSG